MARVHTSPPFTAEWRCPVCTGRVCLGIRACRGRVRARAAGLASAEPRCLRGLPGHRAAFALVGPCVLAAASWASSVPRPPARVPHTGHTRSPCLRSRCEGTVVPGKWGDPLSWLQKPSKHKKKKHKKEKEERSKDKKKSKKKPPAGDGAAGPVENGTLEEEPLPVRALPAPCGPGASLWLSSPAGGGRVSGINSRHLGTPCPAPPSLTVLVFCPRAPDSLWQGPVLWTGAP